MEIQDVINFTWTLLQLCNFLVTDLYNRGFIKFLCRCPALNEPPGIVGYFIFISVFLTLCSFRKHPYPSPQKRDWNFPRVGKVLLDQKKHSNES